MSGSLVDYVRSPSRVILQSVALNSSSFRNHLSVKSSTTIIILANILLSARGFIPFGIITPLQPFVQGGYSPLKPVFVSIGVTIQFVSAAVIVAAAYYIGLRIQGELVELRRFLAYYVPVFGGYWTTFYTARTHLGQDPIRKLGEFVVYELYGAPEEIWFAGYPATLRVEDLQSATSLQILSLSHSELFLVTVAVLAWLYFMFALYQGARLTFGVSRLSGIGALAAVLALYPVTYFVMEIIALAIGNIFEVPFYTFY